MCCILVILWQGIHFHEYHALWQTGLHWTITADATKLLSAFSWEWTNLLVAFLFSGHLYRTIHYYNKMPILNKGCMISSYWSYSSRKKNKLLPKFSSSIFATFNLNLLCSDWWRWASRWDNTHLFSRFRQVCKVYIYVSPYFVMWWFYGSFLSTTIYLRVHLHAVGFSGRDLEIKRNVFEPYATSMDSKVCLSQ